MKPALFLDRDGVVIYDSGYAKDADQVRLMPGITDLIQRAQKKSWKVVIVTNQSGLGRGWISLSQYQAVSERMLELLSAQQILIDGIYFAPWFTGAPSMPENLKAPEFKTGNVQEKGCWCSEWRKPWPGMFWQAALDLSIDLKNSVMIGDRATDQLAAAVAGVEQTYLRPSEPTTVEQDLIPTLQSKVADLGRDSQAWFLTQSHLKSLSPQLRRPADLALKPQMIEDFAEVVLS